MMKYVIFVVILVIMTPLISCRPEPVAPDDARVLIIQPSPDSVLSPGAVTVRTYVDYFKLVDKPGQAKQQGEGHLIFYKDVNPPTLKGASALTAEGSYIISFEKSYTWQNIGPGKHVFWVQLVNNDNTVLEPPAAIRVPVTVVN